jgi:chromosome segregation ATPase
MAEENDYVERLEKIIDKQDDLLTHLDSKFNQQQALNNELSKQNQILREDIKKHKNLLRDMNKTVTQHKNVVKKLKKELEQQLKLQQELHKDYGEVIKGLTDELEEEKNKTTVNMPPAVNNVNNTQTKSNKVELPPREHQTDYVASATNVINDIKDKSSEAVNELSNQNNDSQNNAPQNNQKHSKFCKNCGAEIQEGYVFCDSCGTKL